MTTSPVLNYVEGFVVTGFSVRTQNKDEFDEKTAKLPGLWQQFYTSKLTDKARIFGVYSNYDSDANSYYTVTAGVESYQPLTQLNSVSIHSGNYLIFYGSGSMPAAVFETWKQVWEFFEKNTEPQRNFVSDFELYYGPDQVAIYIGLK